MTITEYAATRGRTYLHATNDHVGAELARGAAAQAWHHTLLEMVNEAEYEAETAVQVFGADTFEATIDTDKLAATADQRLADKGWDTAVPA